MATTIAKAVVGSKVKGMTKGLGGKENVSAHEIVNLMVTENIVIVM